MQTSAESFEKLLIACNAIAAHDHMHPSPEVDTLFDQLLAAMREIKPEDEEEAFAHLGELAYRVRDNIVHATGSLEGMWARRIIASDTPKEEVTKFPFFSNYRGLVHEEWKMVREHAHDVSKALFVGSGSFALSLIQAHAEGVREIVGFDREKEANERAAKLLGVLGVSNVAFITADAETFEGYDAFPVIFVAALVGLREDEKMKIVNAIIKRSVPGTLLVVRSASGLKKLFYPGFNPQEVDGAVHVATGRFDREVLSSVHMLKVKASS